MRVIVNTKTGETSLVELTPEEVAERAELSKPTNQDVNAERDRRVRAGATFTPAGYTGTIRLAGDPTTRDNLDALALAANVRLGQGNTTHITRYRDEDNIMHDLVPGQVLDLWSQAAAFVESLYAVSWALKDGPEGIPADYTEDIYWP